MRHGHVTFVVVSWNSAALLRRCLERMCAITPAVEVIVVDNASTDGSPELVRSEFGQRVSLIETGENLGFGRAANRGVSAATTPWVALANADVEVSQNALSSLTALAESDPHIGLAAPRLVDPDGSPQASVYRFPRLSTSLLAALGVHRLHPRVGEWLFGSGKQEAEETSDVEWVMGAFLLLRKAAFDDSGGFARDQWMYAEDLDLAWRLREKGWRRVYVPKAEVTHVRGASTHDAFGGATGTVEITRAGYHWLKTRRGPAMMWLVAAATMVGLAARVGVYAVGRALGASPSPYSRAKKELFVHIAASLDPRNDPPESGDVLARGARRPKTP